MREFGLIGYPLSHSFSPTYFNEKFYREGFFDCSYKAFELEDLSGFKTLLKTHPDLEGLNVTIPYKQSIIDYLDEVDPAASEIGAVNTIRFKGSRCIGYNTDHVGFTESLRPFLTGKEKRALVLGTGGASRAVCYGLQQLGIESTSVSRSPAQESTLHYEALNKSIILDHLLIINTSPLGMYPEINKYPDIPYEFITRKHILYDLVYNPAKTIFLIKGEMEGARIKNGLEMLYIQAERAWEIWNNKNDAL